MRMTEGTYAITVVHNIVHWCRHGLRSKEEKLRITDPENISTNIEIPNSVI